MTPWPNVRLGEEAVCVCEERPEAPPHRRQPAQNRTDAKERDGAVPIHHHVYSGNCNDERTHIGTWEALCRIHQACQSYLSRRQLRRVRRCKRSRGLNPIVACGPNQVWCSDITYIPMQYGFMYLVAVMDWWSRYVLSWSLSNTMESEFCIRAWEQALAEAGQAPLISNTDQGSQFTSLGFIDAVQSAGVDVSMDGRGRWIDNRFIERLWRSVKYEDVYLNDYGDGLSADRGLRHWFGKYNHVRPHQSLGHATPGQWYRSPEDYDGQPATWEAVRVRRPRRPRSQAQPPSRPWNSTEEF